MEKTVWTLMVAVTLCVTWTSGQSAVWNRGKNGLLHVSMADIPGVHNVTVTVEGDKGGQSVVFIPHVSADKTWRAVIPDITKSDVIHYVIEYRLVDTLHRVTGSHSFITTETEVNLGSERYIQRRATTVFYDDFSSGHIDSNKWTHDMQATGLGHFLIYSPEHANSYVKNGVLYIKPTLTVDRFGHDIMTHGTIDANQLWGDCQPRWGGGDTCVTHAPNNRPVISASLRSSGHIRYGKVEVVAKLPKGDWIWPAIWMMPLESHYGGWPRSGEIDIMEATGNLHLRHPNGNSVGVDCDHAHIHYGTSGDSPGHARQGAQFRLSHGTFADAFHTFWLDWNENHIRIGVDSHTVLAVNTPSESFWNQAHLQGTNIWASGGKNAPFDRSFYLILDVSVAGGMFWSHYINEPYARPWTADGPPEDFQQFWAGRHLWLPTWHGEDVAMKVRSVKMQQY